MIVQPLARIVAQPPNRWTYGYPELAKLLGMGESAVRQAVRRKTFNPEDLVSVFELAMKRRGRDLVSRVEAALGGKT